MSVDVPPGCNMDRGKVVLDDHDQYAQHLKTESYYPDLWDQKPGDSDLKVQHGNRIVRLSGVLLVDRQGRDRPCPEVYQDMVKRIEYLKSRQAPGLCIKELEQYVNNMRAAGNIE